jgi:TRAP-type mannitol/chloroaromatic compound transport system permease small subunit
MFWDKYCNLIDKINRWMGEILAWGTVVILLIMLYEVISRYVFNDPTSWAWKVNGQIFSGTLILGGGYILLVKGHVKLDLIYERVGTSKQRLFDMITFPVFCLAFIIVIWQGWRMMASSISMNEHDMGLFRTPLYYGKIAFLVGAVLIFLEGISVFIRKIRRTEDKTDILLKVERR